MGTVTSDQIVEHARRAMKDGDAALARRLLDYVVRSDPSNSEAAMLLGTLSAGRQSPSEGTSREPTYDYAYQVAHDAAVAESLRLGIPPPGPASERLRRWYVVRIWLTVLLVALIPLGVRACWGDYSATMHQQNVDDAQFARSPGCIANATDVDATLPPCTLVPATIVDKSTSTHPSRSYGQYTEYNLRVRESSGATHDYREVSESFWGDVTVGEAVAIKQWRGEPVELDAGSESIDLTTFRGDAAGLFQRAEAWFMVAMGSVIGLQVMWWRPRRLRLRWI
jgi:hypothetical protein